jgi:hypothetical protein
VNKKILLISMALLSLVLLVLPVMAKPETRGPLNAAENNPNADLYLVFGFIPKLDLATPGGVTNRWINWPNGATSRVVIKPADEFKCPNAIDMEDSYMPILTNPEYWNKWVFLSQTGYEALFASFLLPPPADTGGVYMKYNSLPGEEIV